MNNLIIFLLILTNLLNICIAGNCGDSYNDDHGEINFTRSVSSESQLPDCEWRITVAPDKSVLLNIVEINVRYRDKFEVYDGTSELNTSLTQRIDTSSYLSLTTSAIARRRNLLSSGNQMLIKFKANDDYIYLYSKRNYTINMRYRAVPSGCGGTLDKSEGIFSSPGYPNNYYNNIECKWKITVPENHSIIFVFEDFQTELGHDFLKFDSYGLVKFSGTEKPTNFISTSNTRDIYFETDETNTEKGFKISYKALPLETNKTFLIFATDVIIRSNTSENHTIAVSGHKMTKLIDFDLRKETLIWFEQESHKINIKFSNFTTKSVYISGKPNSMALDYIHDHIYWIDVKSKTINVLEINDRNNNIYTICELEDENPRDLIINAKKSVLVWSDVGFEPKIMYSNLDGSQRKILYSDSRQAIHLTIDYENERYFFIDLTDHSLYSIDFEGKNEKFFITSTLFLDIINSMIVLNNDLYLANEYMIYRIPELDLQLKKSQVLYKVHYFPNFELDDFIMTNSIDIYRHKINGFRILESKQQPIEENRCLGNVCKNLCLPAAQSYRCFDSIDGNMTSTQTFIEGIQYNPRTDFREDSSIDKISIINTIIIVALILTIVLISLTVFRLKRQLSRLKNSLSYPRNARLSIQDQSLETAPNGIDSRSYQNLLEMEDSVNNIDISMINK